MVSWQFHELTECDLCATVVNLLAVKCTEPKSETMEIEASMQPFTTIDRIVSPISWNDTSAWTPQSVVYRYPLVLKTEAIGSWS